MKEGLKFLADRLAEKTTWAAILGLLSAVGLATGVGVDDAVVTNLSAVGAIAAGFVGIVTKERASA